MMNEDRQEPKNKRNYIRRKKYLTDCISQIKTTVEFIQLARGERPNSAESEKQAIAHAQSIEAHCWSPHSHLSAESYQQLMSAKTQELCRTILKKTIPTLTIVQLQTLLTAILPGRARTPQPVLPVPIIAPPAEPAQQSMDTDFLYGQEWLSTKFVASFDQKLEEQSSIVHDLGQSPFLSLDDDLIPNNEINAGGAGLMEFMDAPFPSTLC